MPVVVNGDVIPDDLIREEVQRLSQLPEWVNLPDEHNKTLDLCSSAEKTIVDRILALQEAQRDPRPIDAASVEAEIDRQKTANGCRTVFDQGQPREVIELQLRMQRMIRELGGEIAEPSDVEVRAFFEANRSNFDHGNMMHVAHIVKNVDETHLEAEARAGIEQALLELQEGSSFGEVADRHSDCKGNGGDLGIFRKGVMVEEFDKAIDGLAPGERTAIFRTPFGFHIAEVRGGNADVDVFPYAAPEIKAFLTASYEQAAWQRSISVLRGRALIQYLEEDAPQSLGVS